jgi:hypothetical protein
MNIIAFFNLLEYVVYRMYDGVMIVLTLSLNSDLTIEVSKFKRYRYPGCFSSC